MSGYEANTKTSIGSIINQPDDPALPKVRLLAYPISADGYPLAIATFENRSRLQYRADSRGFVREETFFPDGRECESIPIGTDTTPRAELEKTLRRYATLSSPKLKISEPGLWPVLEL